MLRVTANTQLMREIVDLLSVLTEEAKMSWGEKGLTVNVVDGSHVALLSATISYVEGGRFRVGLIVGFLGGVGITAPQSGQNLESVLTECGGISYFRDSDDEPHFLQNCSSYLSIFVLYMRFALILNFRPLF